MADKRIQDFATLAEAADDDLILVSSSGETYNIKVSTLKAAVSAALQSTLTDLSTSKADKNTVNTLDQNFKNFVAHLGVSDGWSLSEVTSGAVWATYIRNIYSFNSVLIIPLFINNAMIYKIF